jgi:hypothetical protein
MVLAISLVHSTIEPGILPLTLLFHPIIWEDLHTSVHTVTHCIGWLKNIPILLVQTLSSPSVAKQARLPFLYLILFPPHCVTYMKEQITTQQSFVDSTIKLLHLPPEEAVVNLLDPHSMVMDPLCTKFKENSLSPFGPLYGDDHFYLAAEMTNVCLPRSTRTLLFS